MLTNFIQVLIGGIVQGSIFGLLALGFSLVNRVSGTINLAQGAFCVVGALMMYTLQVTLGLPVVVAALGAVAGTTLFGLLLGQFSFVPGLARLSNSTMLMLTSGLLTAIGGLALVVWGSQPYALPPFSGEQPVAFLGLLFPAQGFWVIGTAMVVIFGIWFVLTRTRLGRALRAAAENPTAAQLMGINVPRMTLLSFCLAVAIGAISGIVIAPATSFEFDTGSTFTTYGFIAIAIGGFDSIFGAVAGGLVLGIISQLATAYVSSLFSDGLALAFLLGVLVWRPQGLFVHRKRRRQDVRDEPRVHRKIVRLQGKRAWMAAGIALVVAIALPWLLAGTGLMSSIVITGIIFISAIGLDVLMGYAGQINLGQAGFMAIGAYVAAVLATNYGVPPLLGLLAGVAASLVVSVLLSLVTMRLRGHYLALATMAFGLLVDSLTVGLVNVTGGPSGLVGIPAFSIGPWSFASAQSMYFLVLGLIVVLLLALFGGLRSGFGRALIAVRTDQLAAAALGVNVPLTKMVVFAISATLGSLSGSLYAYFFHFLSPDMVSTTLSLQMISMLIIGGEGTLVGPLLGVALLNLLPNAIQSLALYKTLASGALLVIFFLYLPAGLFGVLVRGISSIGRRPPIPLEPQAPATVGGKA